MKRNSGTYQRLAVQTIEEKKPLLGPQEAPLPASTPSAEEDVTGLGSAFLWVV